jgi:hypothetical protein
MAVVTLGAHLAACAPMRTPSAQGPTPPPVAQAPSPMVEHTRAHERLAERPLDGVIRTTVGPAERPVSVFIPSSARTRDTLPVVVHFHGAAWLPHQAVAALPFPAVSVAVNLGAGSSAYGRPFADTAALDALLRTVQRELAEVIERPVALGPLTLTSFSAGYGAVRAILRTPRVAAGVHAVLLLDGLHTSYVPEGRTMADGGVLDTANLVPFLAFARAAVRGERRLLITHSEIFPGSYASTTETADWMLGALQLARTPVLVWGPRGMQQLSAAQAGGFELLGYAGNSAPDHVDQLHALPELLARLLQR